MATGTRSRIALWLLAAAVLAAGWVAWRPGPGSSASGTPHASGLPVVMRTPGGALEIATVTVDERFTRSDSRQFWGIPLGTTVSVIQVPVTYRFHIELARDWPVELRGSTAVVRTGEVKAALPVAIDTGRMEKYTQSGWARFDKDENLARLERSITAELATRAQSPQLRQLALESGRATVREFVTRWQLKEQRWQRGEGHRVVVLFPGETEHDRTRAD